MKAWIARDKNGSLYFYNREPKKNNVTGIWNGDGICFVYNDFVRLYTEGINPQWSDDEPIEVELKIEKV